jgi:hypothetical protein
MHTPQGLDTASAAITRQTEPVPTGSLVGPRVRPLDYSFYCRIDHCSFHGPVSGSRIYASFFPVPLHASRHEQPPSPSLSRSSTFSVAANALRLLSSAPRRPSAAPVPAVPAWNSRQLAALLLVLRNPNSRSSLTSCNVFELQQFLSV